MSAPGESPALSHPIDDGGIEGSAGAPGSLSAFWGRLRKGRGWLALAVGMLLLAIVGPWISPHDATTPDLANRLASPLTRTDDGTLYLLGTDSLGRDVWTRLLLGARASWSAALLGVAGGIAAGVPLGMAAGYRGGVLDAVLMRIVDGFLSLPLLLIALLLAVIWGPGLWTIVGAAVALQWARFARLARGETLPLRERRFVAASLLMGGRSAYILRRHILPNLMPNILVLGTLQLGWVALLESTLSFLGAGIPEPQASWGSMLAAGRQHLATAWWLSVFPGIAISLLVVTTSRFGDALRTPER